jgi:hypothetical protein
VDGGNLRDQRKSQQRSRSIAGDDVNRWQAWAARLRMRHGRIDAWRAPGAMVLLRGQGAAYSARTIVRPALHLHTHFAGSALFTVSMHPALARTMILRSLAPFAGARRHEPAAAGHAQVVLAPAPVHRAAAAGLQAPAFVPARRLRAASPSAWRCAGARPRRRSPLRPAPSRCGCGAAPRATRCGPPRRPPCSRLRAVPLRRPQTMRSIPSTSGRSRACTCRRRGRSSPQLPSTSRRSRAW